MAEILTIALLVALIGLACLIHSPWSILLALLGMACLAWAHS